MPVILVTNDDGVYSQGIMALAKALKPSGNVYVVAPEREQSAVGHALTLHRPLRADKIKNGVYSINGTPTDCVILAVNKLLPSASGGRPDIVVSGINRGGNLGDDITYSGTVSAAIEGTLLGIPSIAVSLVGEKDFHFQEAAKFAARLAGIVLKKGLPPDTLLNVNIPNGVDIKGIKFTRQGKRAYDNSIQEMSDPRGRRHYWIGGGSPLWGPGEDTDFQAVQNGFISVTPIYLDLTSYNTLKYLKENWKTLK
ncbi:MAG: 5'/3'-nucleotidase SurE [Nitrospirae bacterium]|nr:5'/3'-nucleotidase SurE [Nitrospirota bacterium]